MSFQIEEPKIFTETDLIEMQVAFYGDYGDEHHQAARDWLWLSDFLDAFLPKRTALGRKVKYKFHTDDNGEIWLMLTPSGPIVSDNHPDAESSA